MLRGTLHKLPPLFLFLLVYNSSYSSFILLSALLSLIVGGFFMFSVLDLRYLVVVSSMANNRFLLLGLMSGRMFAFTGFYFLYFLNIFLLLFYLGGLTKPSFSIARGKVLGVFFILVLLLNIASLPPFPIFFMKFFILYMYFSSTPASFYILVALVLANVSLMVSYCQLFIKYVTNSYSHTSNYLLF